MRTARVKAAAQLPRSAPCQSLVRKTNRSDMVALILGEKQALSLPSLLDVGVNLLNFLQDCQHALSQLFTLFSQQGTTDLPESNSGRYPMVKYNLCRRLLRKA